MPDRFDLLVLGDLNPDIIAWGDVEPRFGQAEKLVDGARLVLGGSGGIMACGAARLGLRVAVAGVVGDDTFGRFVLEELAGRGVDVGAVSVDPTSPTGATIVLSRGDDRAILTSQGTVGALRRDLIDPELVRVARHVHVSSYYLQRDLRPDLPELFREAHRAGATTSVDPNWDPAQAWDGGLRALLRDTDCFFPNSAEARAIGGVEDVDVAAVALAEHGPVVAVKFGQGGGLAISGTEVFRRESVPIDVVDTTGAGDSFDAGFLAGRMAGWPLERCLGLAVACGSLSTRAAGGTAGQPTMAEAMAALETVP